MRWTSIRGAALVALDAVTEFGDDLYLEIKLWNKRGDLLAGETLYEEGEGSGLKVTHVGG